MGNQIWVVAHCILNTASKVYSYQSNGLIEENRLRKQFLDMALKSDWQLIQMPCPEFTMYGHKRWGHVKEQFDNPFFRSHCQKILMPIIEQLSEYASKAGSCNELNILGIEGSPSCGVNLTCSGNWGGEFSGNETLSETLRSAKLCNGSGIFIEEFKNLLHSNGLPVKISGLCEKLIEDIAKRDE